MSCWKLNFIHLYSGGNPVFKINMLVLFEVLCSSKAQLLCLYYVCYSREMQFNLWYKILAERRQFWEKKISTLLGRWEYCPQSPSYLSYHIINKFYLYCFHSYSEISSSLLLPPYQIHLSNTFWSVLMISCTKNLLRFWTEPRDCGLVIRSSLPLFGPLSAIVIGVGTPVWEQSFSPFSVSNSIEATDVFLTAVFRVLFPSRSEDIPIHGFWAHAACEGEVTLQ